MSTQRSNENQIICSGVQNNTVRNDDNIISSADTTHVISSSLRNEVVLNGKEFKIEKQIARSGEAEIFLINQDGNNYVFKHYYSQYKPKDEILVKLKGLQHPDIVLLLDYGYYQDRFFEISEYAQGGTLHEIMPVTSIHKVKEIVSETVNALNYCHNHGIIHRDIKPENIFYRTSDKKDIAIGDFGIASNVKEGDELVRTSLARTCLYAAPELFTNIQGKTTIEKSVDYYALGMTLLHLWFGRNPFEDVDEYGIMRLKSEGRVLFPDNINEDVEKLIKGLITVNPRDRWAYDEIQRWLKGEDVKVNYQTVQFDYKPYSFGIINGEQIVITNPKDLANYLEKYPEKGEGHLYRNTIAKWIEPIDAGLFNELMDIVERDYIRDRVAGLTKAIYFLDQDKPFKVLNGIKLNTQEDIALHFEQHFEHYKKDLQNTNASFYVFLEARNYKDKANDYRSLFKNTNPEAALNTLIYILQGADKYLIENYTIYQPEELLEVDENTKIEVINQLANINSKLSLWITCFVNLQQTIDKWRILNRFDETTLPYALQQGFEFKGVVANDKKEFLSLFNNFFSDFISDTDTKQNQSEANYWLFNYCGSSFPQSVIDYLKSENYSDKEFCQMLTYVLSEHKETGKNIFQVIETLLPQIKSKTTSNDQLLNNVIDIVKDNIESFWIKYYQSQSVYFLDCLNNYLSFAEPNISSYPEFFSQLTLKLDNRISIDIKKDISQIKNNAIEIKDYRNKLQAIVPKLKLINAELIWLKRIEKENEVIMIQIDLTNKAIALDEKNKVAAFKTAYDEQIDTKRKKERKTEINKSRTRKFRIYICICVVFLILLVATILSMFEIGSFANGGGNLLSNVFGMVLAISFSVVGVIMVVSEDGEWWAYPLVVIIGLIGGAYLGEYLVKIISLSIFLYAFIIGTLLFRWIAFRYIKKRNKEIDEILFSTYERECLNTSLEKIKNHFYEKREYETLYRTAEIMIMEDSEIKTYLTSRQLISIQ